MSKRKEIRDAVVSVLTTDFPSHTIDANRVLGFPKEKLPAIVVLNMAENYEATPDRCGYKINGSLIVRLFGKGKMRPEELKTGEIYADDELDILAGQVENSLTGIRESLGGIVDNFDMTSQRPGFDDGNKNNAESIYYLDLEFSYLYLWTV